MGSRLPLTAKQAYHRHRADHADPYEALSAYDWEQAQFYKPDPEALLHGLKRMAEREWRSKGPQVQQWWSGLPQHGRLALARTPKWLQQLP